MREIEHLRAIAHELLDEAERREKDPQRIPPRHFKVPTVKLGSCKVWTSFDYAERK